MIDATCHDRFAAADYQRLVNIGINTARDGLRWHLIETTPGRFDFSSVREQMDAAENLGVQVIWDLFHYGYPEDIDIFSAEFPKRFSDFAAAFAEFYVKLIGRSPYIVPVNEISFFSWIAGDIGHIYPFAMERGFELKRQLVRSTIGAVRSIKSVAPGARIISTEPAVFVRSRPDDDANAEAAENYRLSQYQALDMISGRVEPELGGCPEFLDIIGVNYYPHNQWYYPDREMIPLTDARYRPLSEILAEIYDRYRRPMFIAESGTEDDLRAPWLEYVAAECERALFHGVDLRGLCLYPIVNHPGWDDERHCHNGLWDYCDESGHREIHSPLAEMLRTSRFAEKAPATVDRVITAEGPLLVRAAGQGR
jgi:beta-glucosidase/6-phospho-beta-glucosidase/beta-galactosidase